MARAKTKGAKRTYDASDFKELMDNTGGWARDWNDVLRYLRGPAVYDADFAKNEVPGMIEDVEELQRKGVSFTTDYREVWKALTGEDVSHLPPPEGITTPPTNPIELEDQYLQGLKFPARKNDVLEAARRNKAPQRVMDVLQRLKDQQYSNMGSLLEKVGDLTWDHD